MAPTNAADRGFYAHFVPVTVRWGEMDALGHVNNSVFFRYSEDGRIDYIGKIAGQRPAGGGTGPILADIRCSFLQQLRYPAEVEIATRTARIGRSSLHIEQALFCRDEADAIAAYQAVVVWFDYKAQTSVAVPEPVRERIRALETTAPTES